mmetsp:Transcript_30172/g.44690  ORF Transcript_30172/g.44690 Transcript_30172/m.44690 type:complete len:82 (+) Transcript_30172:70-315(+)|eukprot:CAMPEP_0195521930 /NCGR_PEP_ID=MMETSP0794_2-20130614/19705_1 /TAXON_ID=515487 /ORGANISM="Stephanopyxis turris, Strain CCMP 815" /LENGTH=81 /DNA_ID=CAMNT_0040651587 /DNA_START=68 /DNA_END=313 /DNA_ORIENTATION=+
MSFARLARNTMDRQPLVGMSWILGVVGIGSALIVPNVQGIFSPNEPSAVAATTTFRRNVEYEWTIDGKAAVVGGDDDDDDE